MYEEQLEGVWSSEGRILVFNEKNTGAIAIISDQDSLLFSSKMARKLIEEIKDYLDEWDLGAGRDK